MHVDGGLRQRLVVPAAQLHPSATLSAEQLALVETLSIGGHAVRRAAPTPDDRALVIGAGPIGLSVALFLRAAGVVPLVAEISPERRAFAGEAMGLRAVDPGDDAIATIRVTRGKGHG